jgi:hypothetical protein
MSALPSHLSRYVISMSVLPYYPPISTGT